MLNLRNFFKDHFNTREVSDDNLHKFAEDHINRLMANNGSGAYDDMITVTRKAHDTFYTYVKQEDQAFTTQQGKTLMTDKVLAEFTGQVSRREGAIRAAFGRDSAEYQEFFPGGLNEYHKMTKANAEMLMERMQVKTQTYVGDLGTTTAGIFADLLGRYKTARQAQLTAMGVVDRHKSGAQDARGELTKQLMRNLMTLGIEYMGEPDYLADFFSQEIVRRDDSDDEGKKQGTVGPESVVNLESSGVSAQSELTFHNKGTVELLVGRNADNMSVDLETARAVPGGATLRIATGELGTGTYLNVRNSTTTKCAYEWVLV